MTDRLRELADLLHELREAGWVRTLEFPPIPCDADGAPMSCGDSFHQWARGVATIQLSTADSDLWPMRGVVYDMGYGDDAGHIDVGVDWVRERGIGALRRLAEAAGVIGADLYPPTCKECEGVGATVVVPGLGVSECGRCGGAGVVLAERFHCPHLAAVTA